MPGGAGETPVRYSVQNTVSEQAQYALKTCCVFQEIRQKPPGRHEAFYQTDYQTEYHCVSTKRGTVVWQGFCAHKGTFLPVSVPVIGR